MAIRKTPLLRTAIKGSKKQRRRRFKGRIKSTKHRTTQNTRNPNNDFTNTQSNTHNVPTASRGTAAARVQQTLHGPSVYSRISEAWGHPMLKQPGDGALRIAFQNIGPQKETSNNAKTYKMSSAIFSGNYDVFMLAEHGLNMSQISQEHRWPQRLGRAFHDIPFSNITYNRHEHSSWKLWGGSGIILTSTTRSMKLDHGMDSTGLGRFCWARLRGKNNTTVKLISAYRPVLNRDNIGSVWRQQYRYLQNTRGEGDPCDWFFDDLRAEIQKSVNEQEPVILGIDLNGDVSNRQLVDRLHPTLQEAIIKNHSPSRPPPTSNRNSQGPIDGIFTSPGVIIEKAGYLPFDDDRGSPSDHRLLWIEVDQTSILGYSPPPLLTRVAQRLNSRDPILRKRYITRVRSAFVQADIPRRVKELQNLIETHKTSPLQDVSSIKQMYDTLHEEMTLIRLKIERKLRPVRRGGKMWSPKLQTLRDTIEFWTRALKLSQKIPTSRTALCRLATKLRITQWKDLSPDDCLIKLKDSYKTYKTESSNADNWRDDHLDRMAEALAEEQNIKKESILKQLRQHEQQRQQGRKARYIRAKGLKEPVVRVTYKDPTTNTDVECLSQAAIVEACTQSNVRRQLQAHDTPFMCSPLLDEVGYLADGPAVSSIIDGTYTPPAELDIYTKEFLKALTMPNILRNRDKVTLEITAEEHKRGWLRQNERVSSEPHGLSFSHYRSATYDYHLNRVDCLFRTIPLEVGFVPERWKTITDVEILKKSGIYDVDKMRLIQLMPADFQSNNKLLGKRIMSHAEHYHTLSPDQHGSRKNHNSILACLNKVLIAGIFTQTKRAGAFCMNDAKSCYDRILHPVAILCLLSQGADYTTCKTLFETLQLASHHIKTGFGITKDAYNNPPIQPPLHGTGQGNGHGPMSWGIISTPVINAMKAAGHGFHSVSALTRHIIKIVCTAFVDDADSLQSGKDVTSTGEDVMTDFQQAVHRWEGLIRATGGAIEPSKSFWYLIDFAWDPQLLYFQRRSKDDMPGQLQVRDTLRQLQTLHRYETWEAQETLGVHMAMDGNQEAQVERFCQLSQEFADRLRNTSHKKTDVRYVFQFSFMKSIEYPMVATTLTEKQWDIAMKPAMKATLNGMGLAANFSPAAFYGPTAYQGLGFMHPYFTQEIRHIVTRIEEGVNASQTGNLLIHSAEAFRVELGLSDPLHLLPYNKCDACVSDCWYKTLWSFLHKYDIQIQEGDPWDPNLRVHDKSIMTAFLQAGYKGEQLRLLNLVRLQLKAFTIADIASADGTHIAPHSYKALRSNNLRQNVQWPRPIPHLSEYLIRHWQLALRNSILQAAQPANGLRLRQQLGKWTIDCRDLWTWRFSLDENRLYTKDQAGWRVYMQHGNARRKMYSRTVLQEQDLPHTATLLATVDDNPDNPIVYRTRQATFDWDALIDPHSIQHHASLQETLSTFRGSPQYLLDGFTIPLDDGTLLAQGIQEGTSRAITDGSYDPFGNTGSSGFKLYGHQDDPDPLVGVNFANGNEEEQSSYRSEACGVIGILTMLHAICTHHEIQDGNIIVKLDNASVVNDSQSEEPLRVSKPHFDLLVTIRNLLNILPIKVEFGWIKGHQDDDSTARLDWWAKRNIECDALAKDYLRRCKIQNPPRQPMPNPLYHERWSISYDGRKHSCLDIPTLYAFCFGRRTLGIWNRRHQLQQVHHQNILWEEAQTAQASLPWGQQQWKIKFLTGFLPTNFLMHKRGSRDNPICPRCPQAEHTLHVLQCQAPRAKMCWGKGLVKLQERMEELQTDPDLAQALVRFLSKWQAKQPMNVTQFRTTPPVYSAMLHQQTLGWDSFLYGRWHKTFQHAQQLYYNDIGSKKSPKRWTIAILKKLFQISWDMWADRNDEKFRDGGQQSVEDHAIIMNSIHDLWAEGRDSVAPKHSYLFNVYDTIEDLDNASLQDKRNWVKDVRQAQERLNDPAPAAPRQLQLQQQFMRQWLQ